MKFSDLEQGDLFVLKTLKCPLGTSLELCIKTGSQNFQKLRVDPRGKLQCDKMDHRIDSHKEVQAVTIFGFKQNLFF